MLALLPRAKFLPRGRNQAPQGRAHRSSPGRACGYPSPDPLPAPPPKTRGAEYHVMDEGRIASWMRRTGGVARTTALHDAGASRYRIQTAIETGTLRRVRRGWVALPDADAELVAAARHGVVIACVSAARRLGLWVLSSPKTDPTSPRGPTRVEPRHSVQPCTGTSRSCRGIRILSSTRSRTSW